MAKRAKRIIIVFQFTGHEPFHGSQHCRRWQPYNLVISCYDDAVLNDYATLLCSGNSSIFLARKTGMKFRARATLTRH